MSAGRVRVRGEQRAQTGIVALCLKAPSAHYRLKSAQQSLGSICVDLAESNQREINTGSMSFHTQLQTHNYSRQQARNMFIPDWEVMCRETLSLAEMNRTVPRLSVTSERAAAEVAEASPSMTRRMLALSTGATVYCFTEAGTCRRDRENRNTW